MRKRLIIAIGITILFNSCIKEKFDSAKLAGLANLTPGILVPIGYATMRMSTYLNDSFPGKIWLINSDKSITLIYHEKVFSVAASGIISIPDISSTYAFLQPNNTAKNKNAQVSTQMTDTAYFNLVVQGATAEIDSINFRSGIISIDVVNTLNLNGSCKISFPGIQGTANSLSITTLSPGDNIVSLDLSKGSMELLKNNGNPNFIKAVIDLDLTSLDNFLPGTELLSIKFSMSNIRYSVLYGNIGNMSFPLDPGTFNLGFYQRLINGNFYFSDPELELLLTNSIGFPIGIYFQDIHAATRNQGTMLVTGSGVPGSANPKIIKFPGVPFQSESDSIEFTAGNSNLPGLLSAAPTSLFFNVIDSLNPLTSMRKGFITDSSKLEADLQMELPLKGHTDSILLEQDTVNFQFPSDLYTNQNNIKFVYFILNVQNGFPIEIIPQVYFTNNSFQVIDSLITDQAGSDKALIHASGVNADGSVSAVTSDQILVKFSAERIQKIINATHLVTRGKMVSSGATSRDIRFLFTPKDSPFYSLSFNLGVIVQLQVNTGL